MYCRFCGSEINNPSGFCSSCGKQQDSVKKSSADIKPSILRCIIGIFFILGGVLPYVLQGDLAEYDTYIGLLISNSSPINISAISCFTQFSSFFSTLFYFSSSALSVYTGLLLLKDKSSQAISVIACAIMHTMSIIHSGIINLLIYIFPKFVLSLYTSDESIIRAGEDIIKQEPHMLYYYQDNAICRFIISVVLIALAAIYFLYINDKSDDGVKTSSVGGIAMILSISVLSIIRTVLSASLKSRYYGVSAVVANRCANYAFELNISSTVIFMFIVIIGIAVIFTRINRWIIAIPTISITVILGSVAFLLSDTLIRDLGTSNEYLSMTLNDFRSLIISSIFILIAMFYWFNSVSRNKIPKWLQFTLPLSLPVIYIGIELIANILHINNIGISFGLTGVALITVITSLVLSSNKHSIDTV